MIPTLNLQEWWTNGEYSLQLNYNFINVHTLSGWMDMFLQGCWSNQCFKDLTHILAKDEAHSIFLNWSEAITQKIPISLENQL